MRVLSLVALALIALPAVAVAGDITGSSGTGYSVVSFSGAGTLNVGGTLLANGTLTTFSGCTINYNGAAQSVKASTSYQKLIFSGSGSKTFGFGVQR